jgi:hypothetical protein
MAACNKLASREVPVVTYPGKSSKPIIPGPRARAGSRDGLADPQELPVLRPAPTPITRGYWGGPPIRDTHKIIRRLERPSSFSALVLSPL